MEKLIVKNFGPINEAEIDLTKYVVFIGDTSTGKSVLAKLIAIFRDNDLALSLNREEQFKNSLIHYNIDFEVKETKIEYFSEDCTILFSDSSIVVFDNNGDIFTVENNKDLRPSKIIDSFNNLQSLIINEITDQSKKDSFLNELNTVLESYIEIEQVFPVYFPAERMLVSIIGTSISGLWANNVALPTCFKDFAAKYEVAKKDIKQEFYYDLGLIYSYDDGVDHVIYDGYKIKLAEASSGMQSLLPLLLVLEYELHRTKIKLKKSFVIEEPESNLFPVKQKKLIEHIVKKLSLGSNNLVITTHSPYILSVLDTLILAKNTFNEHPELKEEIDAIVSEDKWIDYNDISVYEVLNDGTIRSIKNEEFKSIDTNAIDRVSDIISAEFDKLTELRYAQ